jgi:serine/threonine-protein kinase
VDLPTGSYAPVFRFRDAAASPGASQQWRGAIAVLPFANLSADRENDYFSDGLTQELIHQLTQVQDLRVVAWGTAAQIRETGLDIRAVGERLKVATALVGSVRRAGDRLRVTVQLAETATGVYLWSETYDRELCDLFAIQEEIASSIVRTLRLGTSIGRRAYNLEAYDLYLKGRVYWNHRTLDGLWKSVELFQQSVARDPGFALGYAGLSDAYSVLADHGLVDPSAVMDKSKAAALKALEIDPLLAEPYTSLGFIRSAYEWKWDEGERDYLRSIELNPGYATAHHWFGIDYLAQRKRFAQAHTELEIARQLDPLSPIIAEGNAYCLLMERRYPEAIQAFEEQVQLHRGFYKNYTSLGRTYGMVGRYDEAIAMLEKGRAMGGDVPHILSCLGQVYALAGNPARARELLGELAALAARAYVPSSCFAIVHLGLGDYNRALECLETGCGRRDLPVTSISAHPVYDPLRNDPRFRNMLRAIGLDD